MTRIEATHFIDCIKGFNTPLTDGKMGLRIVKILEAATLSLKNNGRLEQINLLSD